MTLVCVYVESVGLPAQCSEYSVLDDASRNLQSGSGNEFFCDDNDDNGYHDADTSPDWKDGDKWYRFMGEAGDMMLGHTLETLHCGTQYPGWLRDPHPEAEGETKEATVCFTWDTGKHFLYQRGNLEILLAAPLQNYHDLLASIAWQVFAES